MIIPKFIIKELQHIADSSEPIKRVRGRRGLDVLKRMQKDIPNVSVKITNHDFPNIKEADLKLVELARRLKGIIITNDFNLNKVARLQNVKVMNLNQLSNALKPVVLPGETMSIHVVKEGKEENQGVGYLDDGTMVVVDEAKRYLGDHIEVSVTSVLQTPTGRMIFSRVKDEDSKHLVSDLPWLDSRLGCHRGSRSGKTVRGRICRSSSCLFRGKPVLAYSVETISKSDLIGEIIIVVPEDWARAVKTDIVDRFSIPKVTKIIPGGPERQDSVLNGFNSLSGTPDIVAVHDGARPLVSLELLEEVIRQASACGAALAALPSNDTIKKSSPDMYVDSTVPRESLWFAQTPQAFRYEVLKNALSKAADDRFTGTDESLLVERTGVRVKIVKGSPYNIKITTPEDLRLGELILNMREGGAE